MTFHDLRAARKNTTANGQEAEKIQDGSSGLGIHARIVADGRGATMQRLVGALPK
jgi:hypothetical protein